MTPRKHGEMVANHKEKARSNVMDAVLHGAFFVTINSFHIASILYDFFVTDCDVLVRRNAHSTKTYQTSARILHFPSA